MELSVRTRMRVLETVTVSKLQEATEEGLKQLGHRSLERLIHGLDNMTWKTALTGHLPQICAMEALLLCLLHVCSNGLLPHKMLEKALFACHSASNFEMNKPANATGPNWKETCIKYLLMRLRMITAKIRELAGNQRLREQVFKKTSQQQQQSLMKLCRVINPELQECQSTEQTLAVQDGHTSDEERAIEANFKLLTAQTAERVPATVSSASSSAKKPSSDFLSEATKRALQAAMATSPAKPLSKKARMEAAQEPEAAREPEAAEEAEAEAEADEPQVLKKPACRKPAAAKQEELFADGFPLEHYGCSRCRKKPHGCSQCKAWAVEGHRGYFVTSTGKIARKKQG